jgi:hypothetical protein
VFVERKKAGIVSSNECAEGGIELRGCAWSHVRSPTIQL